MKKILLMSFALHFLFLPSSFAGICTAMINRSCPPEVACRGSETRTTLTNNPAECQSFARELCQVHFKEGVLSKQVRANFDQQPVQGGQNLCQ
ncbi:MAG: hypothetical protein JNK65_02720 [Deltaproteobacteria bacterium]|nr:hypothetical protein [Deltaproteobacteria bacterium]